MAVNPKIVSLIPSATEIVYLLGLGDNLIARSHDSDYPLEAQKKKVLSVPLIDDKLSSLEIDKAVQKLAHSGTSVFHVDQKKLNRLKPDIVLTQELCSVCMPEFTEIRRSCRVYDSKYRIVSLEPKSINEVFDNIFTVAAVAGMRDAARAIVERLKYRIDSLQPKHKNFRKPKVAVIEWLNPLMIAGHWVPEMVQLAGGEILMSEAGKKSRLADWYEIVNANPEVLIFAPIGFDIERAKKEMYLFKYRTGWDKLKAVKNNRVYYMNGDAHLTRSGPRLVDGVEIMAKIFHPTIFGSPLWSEAQLVI